jgi:hypothetical protein
MILTSDRWEQWSTSEQEDFLDNLRRKLRLYQIYHDDTDLWIALSEGGDAGESVYPVPIKALPRTMLPWRLISMTSNAGGETVPTISP